MFLIDGGRDAVNQATLDFCNFAYTSEKLRQTRVQVEYGGANSIPVGNEFVRYRAGGSASGFAELQKAVTGCPATSQSNGVTYSLVQRAATNRALVPHQLVLSFQVFDTTGGIGLPWQAVAYSIRRRLFLRYVRVRRHPGHCACASRTARRDLGSAPRRSRQSASPARAADNSKALLHCRPAAAFKCDCRPAAAFTCDCRPALAAAGDDVIAERGQRLFCRDVGKRTQCLARISCPGLEVGPGCLDSGMRAQQGERLGVPVVVIEVAGEQFEQPRVSRVGGPPRVQHRQCDDAFAQVGAWGLPPSPTIDTGLCRRW